MERWAGLLFSLGLMLGPGYYLYANYLSGEPGPSFVMTERAARWTLPDGTILRYARSQAYRPVEVELSPEMNRIGIELVFDTLPATDKREDSGTDIYQVTLMQADQLAFMRQIELALEPGRQEKVKARSLEVYLPAKYVLTLEAPITPRTPVSQVTLQLRLNMQPALMPLVWTGVVLLAAGLALFLEKRMRVRR
jgi:hypothetical protein